MRGYPIRVEIGPKDLAAGKCVLCRRDTREKIEVNLEELEAKTGELLETIQRDMLERARKHRESHTCTAVNMEEFEKILTKSRALSRPCGAGTRHARYILRRSSASPAAACLLTRNTFRIPAYAAENLPGRWCTGDGHINVNETRTRSGGSAEMKRDTLREQAVRKERAGNDS